MAYNNNYGNGNRLPERTFKGIPGEMITWRCMEDNAGDGRFYNHGNRYFAIKLSDEEAEELENEGWPID